MEQDILTQLAGGNAQEIILDAADLEYISSAGLRVILRLKKSCPALKIVNVNSEVYEILDMTGFTEMMTVEKAYRVVSVEGCEEIGRGANGTIYRIDQDNVVKVYNNADALAGYPARARGGQAGADPRHPHRHLLRRGEGGGQLRLRLRAAQRPLLLQDPGHRAGEDGLVREGVCGHAQEDPRHRGPRRKAAGYEGDGAGLGALHAGLSAGGSGKKLYALVEAVPHDDHMLHGDYHTKNLELQNDEVLLIDMDTLAVGHPIFELGSMYNAFVGFSEQNHEIIQRFQGFDFDTAQVFWHKSLAAYLGTSSERKLREVEDKARIIGYTRMIRRSIRRQGLETEEGRAQIAFWKERLLKLLDTTDTLLFTRSELEIEAVTENLPAVQAFVEEHLEAAGCPMKAKMQIGVAVEEIFVNIANYAYAPEKGTATVRVEFSEQPVTVAITFVDHGVPYDPLAKVDPDVKLSAEEREIGGLGIFMTKKMMDDVSYCYRDGHNILTLKKNL